MLRENRIYVYHGDYLVKEKCLALVRLFLICIHFIFVNRIYNKIRITNINIKIVSLINEP